MIAFFFLVFDLSASRHLACTRNKLETAALWQHPCRWCLEYITAQLVWLVWLDLLVKVGEPIAVPPEGEFQLLGQVSAPVDTLTPWHEAQH